MVPVSAPLTLGKGFVGQKLVKTLFDSGANIIGVDWKHVPKSVYTGKYIRCRTFSGCLEIYPQCRIFIRTLFYTGLMEASILRKPICDLIIRQLRGIKKCTNQKIKAWYKRNGIDDTTNITRCGGRQNTHTTKSYVELANVIRTRSATRKYQEMLSREQWDINITPKEIDTRRPQYWRQQEKLIPTEEEDDKLEDQILQTQERETTSVQRQHRDNETQTAQQRQDIERIGEINAENTMHPRIHEENTKILFAQEQQRGTQLKKCFQHAIKADYHYTRNGK